MEPYRPRLHFSPLHGWMNDPNGLIKVDGAYHLFFQHDPDSITHGPMHWGHARSTDLVSWEELPVALYPTELGTCFSGSAVETADGELKLIYTAHRRIDDEDYQVQCLVHANRSLSTYRHDEKNPVLDNPGLPCFRDPKVIWHAPSQRWIMVVTHGQSIGFYSSPDLSEWTHESDFGVGHGRHSDGPWECPDLFPMTGPDGAEHWILLVGVGSGGFAAGSGTQYFVGQFNGRAFINGNRPGTTLWLDYGRDFYAAQTFFDREGADPIVLGWASNWQYARSTPTEAFRSVMSLPRTLSLVEARQGLRLTQSLPAAVSAALNASTEPGVYRRKMELPLAIGQSMDIALFAEHEPQFRITRTATDEATILVIRSQTPAMPAFGHNYGVPASFPKAGPLLLDIHVDRGVVELATGDGLIWITQLFYPHRPESVT